MCSVKFSHSSRWCLGRCEQTIIRKVLGCNRVWGRFGTLEAATVGVL